jgi:hypothetical protein
MNLEALAVRRAQEQLDAGAWRSPEPKEAEGKRLCQVPGCENPIPAGKGAWRTCLSCHEAGYVAVPCHGCGGKLKRSDRGQRARWRNYCHKCRTDLRLLNEQLAPRRAKPRQAGLSAAMAEAA